MSRINDLIGEVIEKKYTLREVEKKFDIPVRKAAFLIKKDIIEPIVENGKIYLSEKEIKRYLALPGTERSVHHKSFLKTLGPGVITGASDDDPSGIQTYSTVGATYGLSLSWLAIYLLPMMSAVQETCARIGIVTGKGLAKALSEKYGRRILFPLIFLLVIANTINIGADIAGMTASIQLLIPRLNFYTGALILTIVMILIEVLFKYHNYSKILKILTFSLLSYIVTGIIIQPNWFSVLKNVSIPSFRWDPAYMGAIVAVMGTTISPYLFFWQTSEEVEEKRENRTLSDHHRLAIKAEISDMRKDTFVGMSLANIVFLFIVITTAFVLNNNGITHIETAAQAAEALRPLAGNFAYILFTLGIVGTGLLAVPVLAGSSAYAISELFKWHEGLNRRYSKAKGFYGVIIASMFVGLLINFIGISPIKSLYYAAIVNGITAPILLVFIFSLGRDKKVMGDFTSPNWVNLWGFITTFLMFTAATLLIVFIFLGVQ